MQNTANTIDSEELLHLAIRASQANKHEEAISYLKRAINNTPENGKIYYMLGAEHAEIGMYERAIEEMAKAVKFEPGLHTAHFQLGLLYITSARVKEAEEAWAPLDKLSDKDPLRLFKNGLLHLARDEFDDCVALLEKGITLNKANAALNNDMKRMIDEVKARPKTPDGQNPAAPKTTTPPSHVLLSAYQNKDEKPN